MSHSRQRQHVDGASVSARVRLSRISRHVLGLAAMAGTVWLAGCPAAAPPKPPASVAPAVAAQAPADVRWKLYSARRQVSYVKLDLPVLVAGTRVSVGAPLKMVPEDVAAGGQDLLHKVMSETSPAAEASAKHSSTLVPVPADWNGQVSVFSSRLERGTIEGPLVDQLTGQPRMATDAGSFLVPLAEESAGGVATYSVKEPMPLYVRVEVPPAIDAGEYRIPIRIAMPGRGETNDMLSVEVADISLPTEPRVLAVATTSFAELAKIYPETFGAIASHTLDRSDPDQKKAVEQLDDLVKAAREEGVGLFVEDMGPAVHVDALGLVTIDWDAYDGVMQPYLDGTAFGDHIPLGVWLAPVPPRRIRDASTQLWQYIDACTSHFKSKAWVGTAAFLHPALSGAGAAEETDAAEMTQADQLKAEEALKAQVSEMLKLHMPRDMLAVSAPGADVPHGQLWTIDDQDPRLPPAGPMAGDYSVRVWPWTCIARGNTDGGSPTGVKGFVWRDAVARAEDLAPDANRSPLLVIDKTGIHSSYRMMDLKAGLNDAALVGLLQKRGDPNGGVASEFLAGIAGRTAMINAPLALDAPLQNFPIAPPGFLYAGWPADKMIWNQVTPALQKLILESDPGTRNAIDENDPVYRDAKLWLGGTRRATARVAGYTFSLRPARSPILDMRVHLLAENPVDAPADFDFQLNNLPEGFELPPNASGDPARYAMRVAPSAVGIKPMVVAGHIESLRQAPPAATLNLTESHGGAVLRLPVPMPIYRTHATRNPPKADGDSSDWPDLSQDVQTLAYGEMKVATRYLTRPDLLAAASREDDHPATVRWMYDANFIYVLARCPQDAISDQRNTDWPTTTLPQTSGVRWWGTDGLQVELAAVPPTAELQTHATDAKMPAIYNRVVKIAFKPSGVLLVQTGTLTRDAVTGAVFVAWRDGAPAAANLKYGVTVQKQDGRASGYTVEAAIPRAWVEPAGEAMPVPAWRVNVLRHRGSDLSSTSWSGPVVHDDDLAMMGVLLGE